jgi:uncharacterized membrane protein YccC
MQVNRKNTVAQSAHRHRQRMRSAVTIIALFLVAAWPVSAMAYVGPGAGITLLGALWAVVVAFVFMVGGLVIWPLRALLRWRKNSRAKDTTENV